MSTINLQRAICSAHVIARRQNCPQIVAYCPRRQFAVEALTKANDLLALAKAWPDGTTEIIEEECHV